MAILLDSPEWVDVYQLEEEDPVLGGEPNEATGAGMDNIPHWHLAKRTRWLKERVDALVAALGDGTIWVDADAPALLAADGYQRLPSGLILQWGSFPMIDTANGITGTVTLPLAFPTAHLQTILGATRGQITGPGTTEGAAVTALSLTGFSWRSDWSTSVDMTARYLSVGY